MYTFKKEERLCSKKLLEKLFNTGSSFLLYPFRITWLAENLPAGIPVQIVISVSKRKFKRAVDRNLIKRRIREAYRLHKTEIIYNPLFEHNKQIILGISYIGKDIPLYPLIEKKLKAALQKLKQTCVQGHVE